VASEEIFEAFYGDPESDAKFTQVSTFGGHPTCCAAGLANLDILTRERLWENSASTGAYLFEKLRAIRSPWIGEIRGRGLLIGLELVTDANKTPMPEARMVQLLRTMREAGVLAGRNNDTVPGYGNVLILSPPLILSREQADTIASVIQDALAKL
jgi:adenosylmethionine-8-amino-7-oxononanoate aminotransferase